MENLSLLQIKPTKKFTRGNLFFERLAKQLHDSSIIVVQYINMNQNGVLEDIAFVENKDVMKKIKEWKKKTTLDGDGEPYYYNLQKHRLIILANAEENFPEYWHQFIIYNKNANFLKSLKEENK